MFKNLNGEIVDKLAIDSLTETLNTFKPGLFGDSGQDFERHKKGVNFLKGGFGGLYDSGREYSCVESGLCFETLRQKGRITEIKLLTATDGTSTHKGAFFSMGLMSIATGRLDALGISINTEYLTTAIADFAKHYSYRSFVNLDKKSAELTIGEQLYQKYNLTSLRGNAEQGFSPVLEAGLSYLENHSEKKRDILLSGLFLVTLAHTEDSSFIISNGLDAMQDIQKRAATLSLTVCNDSLKEFDAYLKSNNYKPKAAAAMHSLCLFAHKLINIK